MAFSFSEPELLASQLHTIKTICYYFALDLFCNFIICWMLNTVCLYLIFNIVVTASLSNWQGGWVFLYCSKHTMLSADDSWILKYSFLKNKVDNIFLLYIPIVWGWMNNFSFQLIDLDVMGRQENYLHLWWKKLLLLSEKMIWRRKAAPWKTEK